MRFTTILAGTSAIALGNAAPVAQGEEAFSDVQRHGMDGAERQLTPFIIDETKYPFHVRATRTTTQSQVPTPTHAVVAQPPYAGEPNDTDAISPRSDGPVLYKPQRFHPVVGKYNATRPGSLNVPAHNATTEPDVKRPALRKPGLSEQIGILDTLRKLLPLSERVRILDNMLGGMRWYGAARGPKLPWEKASTSTTTALGPKETGKKHSTTTTMAHGPEETGEKASASTTMALGPKETGKKHATTTMPRGPKETGKKALTTAY